MAQESRRGLVEGDLERISSRVFDLYHDEITELVGRRHGVYALYSKGRLYYVGLANNLRSRVKQHLEDRHSKKWDTFSLYLIKNVNYLKELETLILHVSEPQGNVKRGRFATSENLIDTLRDLMKKRDEENRDLILSGPVRRKGKGGKRKKKSSSHVGKGRPVLQGLLRPHTELKGTYKGNVRMAKIDKNGCIILGGRTFDSPSLAGNFVRGGKSTNGWTFWRYQNAKGEWVFLDELRKS